jgi:parvulin-like peptidyl-prolyl isomerase
MSPRTPVVNRSRESKSAAVRAALANPSKRQLSKWERERRQRQLIIGGAAGLLALIALVIAFGAVRELVWRPNEAAAWVHNEKIPLGALVTRLKPYVAAIDAELVRLSTNPNSGNPPGVQSPQSVQQQIQTLQNQRLAAVDQVLTDMIDEELVRLELERRGLRVTPEEITERINIDLARARRPPEQPTPTTPPPTPAPGVFPSPTVPPTLTASEFETAYQDLLQRTNFTDAQYRAYTEAILQKEKLRAALAADIPTVQEQVHVRRLTLSSQEEATAALAQIRTGEKTLEELAREKSLDLTSRNAGGDLGWLPRGIESTQFDDAAFRLQIGEISEPVVTPQGFEVLELLGKEVRPVAPEHLDRLSLRRMEQWLRQAREDPGVRRELTGDRREWVLRQAGILGRGQGGPLGALPRGF